MTSLLMCLFWHGVVGQAMLSRNAVVLTELKSKEGDYGRLLRLSTEANVIIDNDAARWLGYLNKQKLGEPSVYFNSVEQTLYSATVPI